jgi:hypothetical protein
VPEPAIPRAALASALLVTAVELALLFVTLSPRRRTTPRRDTPAFVERVEFVVPAGPAVLTPNVAAAAGRAPSLRGSVPVGSAAPGPTGSHAAPRDSAPTPVSAPPATGAQAAGDRAPGGSSAVVGPVLAPRGFHPSSPLARHVIDSVLGSLNANMPALIWARVPTQAERDAAYKESALAMRLSGRALLVPADPHLAPGIRLPSFFSRQKQRATARARTDSVLAENMARLARLRERARRDSIRRDDSLRAATPRRPPDARTPG